MDPFTALGSVAVTAADALHNLKKSRQECDRLRAEVEALKLERTAAELVHRETATTVLMQMAEVQRLRDALEQIEREANQPYIQRIAAAALKVGE